MISRAAITAWGRTVPWPTVEQVEQDLLLARLIVEIANDDYLGDELVFRGGTCMHKLHAPEPLRYSEDLDYVRSTSGGIRELTQAVTQIGKRLGMEVRTRITEHPKMFLRAHSKPPLGTEFEAFRCASKSNSSRRRATIEVAPRNQSGNRMPAVYVRAVTTPSDGGT